MFNTTYILRGACCALIAISAPLEAGPPPEGWSLASEGAERDYWIRDNRIERPEPPASVVQAARAAFAESLTYIGGDA